MAGRRNKQYDDDDGRVICSMNVPGMPWYSEDKRESKPERKGNAYGSDELSRGETLWVIWGTMRAGLVIAAVFSAMLLVVISVCLAIW